nr:hypothetical protein HmN_000635100 [Hymenolepis microstoma]
MKIYKHLRPHGPLLVMEVASTKLTILNQSTPVIGPSNATNRAKM